jgi:hypothetical protein
VIEELRNVFENVLYPELRGRSRAERQRLLREVADTPFDWVEWMGICASLVLVVALTRYSAIGLGFVNRVAITAMNFVLAIPLLGLTAGPFLVRRTRRGLRSRMR